MMIDVEKVRDILKGRGYDLLNMIGSGISSQCYMVFSQKYKQNFACKVIPLLNNNQTVLKQLYQNEYNILSRITHPNIIHAFDAFSNELYFFLILEYCENGDLLHYIQNNDTLSRQLIYSFIKQILDALSYLESLSITHHDIKPSNIFIDKYKRIKLADFGFSKQNDSINSVSHNYSGTLGFVAPEVISRQIHNPILADVYSFGVTLYYLTGKSYPNSIKTVQDTVDFLQKEVFEREIKDLDSCIVSLLRGSLSYNPNERKTFKELQTILHSSKEFMKFNSGIQSTLMPKKRVKLINICKTQVMKSKAKSTSVIVKPIVALRRLQ